MPQTLLAVLALALASVLLLTHKQGQVQDYDAMMAQEMEMLAVGVTQHVVEMISALSFDERTTPTAVEANGLPSTAAEFRPTADFGRPTVGSGNAGSGNAGRPGQGNPAHGRPGQGNPGGVPAAPPAHCTNPVNLMLWRLFPHLRPTECRPPPPPPPVVPPPSSEPCNPAEPFRTPHCASIEHFHAAEWKPVAYRVREGAELGMEVRVEVDYVTGVDAEAVVSQPTNFKRVRTSVRVPTSFGTNPRERTVTLDRVVSYDPVRATADHRAAFPNSLREL
ncbi:hypothetical protein BH23BAC4_BH23BAC4_10290 [soil metagenome]